jgi:hypothetical protein
MKSDIALAIIGALIGVTIGQLKGEIMVDRLARFFRERWPKIFRGFPKQNDTPSE